MAFNVVLKRIRREKEMSQRAIADLIEMDYGYFSKMESGSLGYNPSRETIEKIATALQCTEAERNELYAAAGRMDVEIEEIARSTHQQPLLNDLFRTAVGLPPEKLRELIEMAKRKSSPTKPKND